MRSLILTAVAGAAAIALATGNTVPIQDRPAVATAAGEPAQAGVIQTGRTLGPLSPDEVKFEPVTVPEPVWASVLAACALSLMRRARV